MASYKEAAKARAERQLAKDPDYFRKISRMAAGKVRNPVYPFRVMKENEPDRLREIARKGGKSKKRKNSES